MEKILSQDEIDALMKGVVSGGVDANPQGDGASATGAKQFDLFNQERIIRGRMPTLELINDRFVRRQSISWGVMLHDKIELAVVGTQITKFGEFLKKVPLPSSMTVFHMEPFRSNGLFVMDAFLVYLIVDYFFGGKGQTHVKPEGRDFTPIQMRVIKKLVQQCFLDLEKAWEALVQVKIQHMRTECNPQFAMVVSVSEIVLVVTLQVVIGETARDLFIVYPYSMLEPIKEKLYSGLVADRVEEDGGWAGRFRDRLQDCPLNVHVQLGTVSVTVQDVLNFTPGDVIVLDQRPGDHLDCFVEGKLKFQGTPGVFKGNQACRVAKVVV